MYRQPKWSRTSIERNDLTTGETIEQKIKRIVHNGEPIKDGAPIQHTDRKEGIVADYNPRTDRFEVAVDAMDKVAKSKIANRMNRIEEREAAEKGVKGTDQNEGGNQET